MLCPCVMALLLLQFFVKGVMYSPSPIGYHPAWTWPHGDFFIPQYQNLWARDFPLLQAMGANTIRIANWNNDLDHGYFLDMAHRAGLKVIVTFNLGNVWQSPVGEDWQQQQVRRTRRRRSVFASLWRCGFVLIVLLVSVFLVFPPQHLGRFIWQFERYLNHPALLAWTFGEQLNLPANGFMQAFADKHQCGWNGAVRRNNKRRQVLDTRTGF